jgi:hypothetical protein
MKVCKTCGTEKPFSEFHRKTDSRDGHVCDCRDCANAKAREKYSRSERYRDKQKNTRSVRRADVLAQIDRAKGAPCSACGKKFPPVAMDFHHRVQAPENKGISNLANRGFGWPRIEKEIRKCILLCANCHRLKHAGLKAKRSFFGRIFAFLVGSVFAFGVGQC